MREYAILVPMTEYPIASDWPHTHVQIDGRLHRIASVEIHADGPKHSHRVHLGCGVTIDTDFAGQKHSALAAQKRAEARAPGQEHAQAELLEHARALDTGAIRHHADHADPEGRWRRLSTDIEGGSFADCPRCAEHEAGKPAHVIPRGHTAPSVVEGDQPTGIRCDQCDSLIYRRRRLRSPDAPVVFACSGLGHEFQPADLVAMVRRHVESVAEFLK